ncbi:unnamed protein product [Eruca vesicaria subsp. sativa]|uniref:Uncharacterized protein n=1 Tax=Eruca vesicaria subsp. sativa TaxID=29727 RepID=A0ABC8M609_ERUVS|nr:unnamed protein product [Eruca vesicaria subsp. sativa]
MWLDMLMVDATIIQATVRANRLPTFRPRLTAGSMYSISSFDVARCAQNFRLPDSSSLIRFSDSTVFNKITEPDSPLPLEGFRYGNETELLGLANTNTQLFDEESVKQLSDADLLKRHVDRAKKVRAQLREEWLKRIARYKARLALLLPPFGE